MRDYNQLFTKGLDYVQSAVVNWDNRRTNLTRSYVESPFFTNIPRYKDRHLAVILLLEERIDEVLFQYRHYQAQQKEIDRLLRDMGVEVQK